MISFFEIGLVSDWFMVLLKLGVLLILVLGFVVCVMVMFY